MKKMEHIINPPPEMEERVTQIMTDPAPPPAMNVAQEQMNVLKIQEEQKRLITAQREKQAAEVETERLRVLAENTRIEQERVARQRDEAAASVRRAGVPLTSKQRTQQRFDRTQRLLAEELAKDKARGYVAGTEPAMTDEERLALRQRFTIDIPVTAEETERLRAKHRTTMATMPKESVTDKRLREETKAQLDKADQSVRDAKRQRIDADTKVRRAEETVTELEEDVAMGRRGVGTAKAKKEEDRLKDLQKQWVRASPLDTASRSIPSGLEVTSNITSIQKDRVKFWKAATAGSGGASLTATDNDFDKWLKDTASLNVLNRTKKAFSDVIGGTQPQTTRGKSLHEAAAKRIAAIEQQIRNVETGITQPSRLAHPDKPLKRPRSRSRSRYEAPVTTEPEPKKAKGTGFSKVRKKRKKVQKVKKVKEDKNVPSTSRYFF